MGVTSCLKICSKEDTEFQAIFGVEKNPEQINKQDENINTDNNLNNVKESKLKETNKNKDFKKIFEKKLPSFGEYIEKEEFNQRIPKMFINLWFKMNLNYLIILIQIKTYIK